MWLIANSNQMSDQAAEIPISDFLLKFDDTEETNDAEELKMEKIRTTMMMMANKGKK